MGISSSDRVVARRGGPPAVLSSLAATSGHVTELELPAGLVLRLLLLLHVGGWLAAPVLVVDLDHLFPGRLIAPLSLCRWLRSLTLAFATGHCPTVHRPRGIDSEACPGDALRKYLTTVAGQSAIRTEMPCSQGAGAAPAQPATAGSATREGGRDFRPARAPTSRPRPSSPAS